MIKIYFTKFSENYNPFCEIFEIIFTRQLLKVTSTYLTEVEISLKRIFMVELSVRRLS